MAGERKTIRSERAPGRNFDLYDAEGIRHEYADGISGVQLTAISCRIDFYRTMNVEPNELGTLEVRDRIFTVTMPTIQFVDFLKSITATLKSNKEGLFQALEDANRGLKSNFEAL